MRFIDQNIRIGIHSLVSKQTLDFKAYLEEIDITFEPEFVKLDNISLLNTANEVKFKSAYKLKITFNVFSEDREECIINFQKLEKLITFVKPVIQLESGETIEDFLRGAASTAYAAVSSDGDIEIRFSGLPRIGTEKNKYTILSKAFSYAINKEMGYIQVPYFESTSDKFKKIQIDGKMKLIPVGFKVNLEGKIILDPLEMYVIQSFNVPPPGATPKPAPPTLKPTLGATQTPESTTTTKTTATTEKTTEKPSSSEKKEKKSPKFAALELQQKAAEVIAKFGDLNKGGEPQRRSLLNKFAKAKDYIGDDANGSFKFTPPYQIPDARELEELLTTNPSKFQEYERQELLNREKEAEARKIYEDFRKTATSPPFKR